MATLRRRTVTALLPPLLAFACTSEDPRAQQNAQARQDARTQQAATAQDVACLGLLVAPAEEVRLTGGRERIGDAFDRLRGRYETMPLADCAEDHQIRARIMASHIGPMADAARRLGNPADLRATGRSSDELMRNPAFMAFMSEIEAWSNRLRVMRADLQRMRAARP